MSQSPFGPAPLENLPAGFTPIAPAAVPSFGASDMPAAPVFNAPAATPPFVAPSSPIAPHVAMQPHSGSPSFLSAAMPILAAVLAGGKDPVAIGAGLAAFQRGRQLKLAEQEHEHDRQRREQSEAAGFYSRAIEQSQQIDDPVAFEQWRQAIAPVAELYGINPAAFQFSDQKRQAKATKDAQGVIDTLRKVHGAVVDDPAWQDAHTTTIDGKPVKVTDLYRMAQLPSVRDLQGGLVGPAPKTTVPNTPEEQFYATFAKEHGAKAFGDLSTTQQAQARQQWQRTNGAGMPNAGSFEDYVTRTYGSNPTPQQILKARKDYNQSDDKPKEEALVRIEEEDADGNLVVRYAPRSEVSGQTFKKPAKEPNQQAYQAGAYAGRMEQAEQTLSTIDKSIAGMNLLSYAAQKRLPAAGQSAAFQSYDQAARNFINAVLRRESGAAISPSEFDSAEKQYLPLPGDAETTLKQKRANRQYVFEQMKRAAGKAYQAPVNPNGKSAVTITSIEEVK